MIKREKLARHPRTKWRIWACDVTPTSRIEQWALRTLVWCSYGQKWQVSAFQMTVVKRREIFRKFICRQTDFPRWDYDRPFRLWIAFGDTGDRLWSSTALPMEQRVNHAMGRPHSHLQSFATPPPRVAVRRREVIRHADGRGWEKMENVEFRNFPSMTSRKSYCISKIIIFETVSRWLTCDYSPRNNTMSHLLPAVIWWPSSRCICRCLLIGGKLN